MMTPRLALQIARVVAQADALLATTWRLASGAAVVAWRTFLVVVAVLALCVELAIALWPIVRSAPGRLRRWRVRRRSTVRVHGWTLPRVSP